MNGRVTSSRARPATLDQNDLRRLNRRQVLEVLLSGRPTSRSEIGTHTGLSASTVSLIVNDLVREGFVAESGKIASTRGRKPILVELRPDAVQVVGIDLNQLAGGRFDLLSNDRGEFVNLTKKEPITPDDVIQLAETLRKASEAEGTSPSAIGISVPAPVDPATGTVLRSSNLGWSEVPLAGIVAGSTGLPVTVESNRICLALSERWSGVAQGASDFIYLHVGWRGMVAGVVANGEVVRGTGQNSGQIGHLQVVPGGRPCRCGNRGCLETVAAGRAIAEAVHERRLAAGIDAPRPESFAELAEAARAGDAICREALTEAGERLADALAGAVTLSDPELVVLGGSSMAAADLWLPLVQDGVTSKTLSRPRIIAAQDTARKSAAGAAMLATHKFLWGGDPFPEGVPR